MLNAFLWSDAYWMIQKYIYSPFADAGGRVFLPLLLLLLVTSLLRLAKVSTSDEGLYTCRPAGTRGEDRVALHVLHPPVVEQRLPSKWDNSQASAVQVNTAFLVIAFLWLIPFQ